jgi:choice-of-anchor B domain-containing protein
MLQPLPLRALALALLLATSSLAPSSAAQADFNVTRLAAFDEHGSYNDIWGYVAPDGREYALLGCREGTAIYNATDPLQPHEVGYFPGVYCLWRDIKTWQTWVYVVNDCSGGVDVIDMQDPEHPVLVNSFGVSLLGHSHNIQVDLQTGRLYACGTDAGMAIYDLAADPVNPPLLKTWQGQGVPAGPGVNGYVHDVYVLDGLVHAGMIQDGLYAILDVSQLPTIQVVSAVLSPNEFTHSTWTTDDGNVVVMADETVGNRNLSLWDIADKTNPVLIASLAQGGQTLPHNPYIRGNVVHASYYELGYIAWDITDPTNPVKIGQFDTSEPPPFPKLFSGAWGCYPLQPSGFIYTSDIGEGLSVLKLNKAVPADPSGRPTLAETWPAEIGTGSALPATVLLTGATFADATVVQFGDVTLVPGQFTVLDDQVIALAPPPAVTGSGLIHVSVGNAAGLSTSLAVPLIVPGTPLLQSGPQQVAVGDSIAHTLKSQPGDLQFLALSLSPQPSPSAKVSFAIGAGFSDLILFNPLPAGPGGTTTLPPVEIPSAGAGLTIYWQFAALDVAHTVPAAVSNATVQSIKP